MEDKNKPVEFKFFARLFKNLKRKPPIHKGQLGVFQYTLSLYADTESLHNVKYDIFVKVKATMIYHNLVEVECIGEPTINESVTPELASIIRTSIPKYLDPEKVKWEILN